MNIIIQNFNPRLPLGRRLQIQNQQQNQHELQSTPSVGKATRHHKIHLFAHLHFNPRLPLGRRRQPRFRGCLSYITSIHAFRWEGDKIHFPPYKGQRQLQSTPSVGKATSCSKTFTKTERYFNPRLPLGRRHLMYSGLAKGLLLQSTPSVGKATR